MNKTILVTGGCGYIGSHTCVALAQSGYRLVILDNLVNSKQGVLARIAALGHCQPRFYQGDVRDRVLLRQLFMEERIDAVIHFAGLKSVGDSVHNPLLYHDNNVTGTLALLEEMAAAKVYKLVFSSSATVYGNPAYVPLDEAAPTQVANPYGRSKLMIEGILQDLQLSSPDWRVACLRYFNPAGAHASGQLGEDSRGTPNNLFPYMSLVAVGKLPYLKIFGNDYPTVDGTGVRDYIHVMDLASGHVQALAYLQAQAGMVTLNLGRGVGSSVLEVVQAFEAASGVHIPYRILPRRPGDVAANWASAAQAKTLLGWQAHHSLADMCADTWRWQSQNPGGYEGELAIGSLSDQRTLADQTP